MPAHLFIEIDGKRYLWRDILELRRSQIKAHAAVRQPVLFQLRQDCRPAATRTAAGRYFEPTLFDAPSPQHPPPVALPRLS
jgi:hypothetical protein